MTASSSSVPPDWFEAKAAGTLDPDQAANALARLDAAWPEDAPVTLLRAIEEFPLGEAPLLHLLAYSTVGAERLMKDPGALLWLSEAGLCETDRLLSAMRSDLRRLRDGHEEGEDFAFLRRQKGRETLRIALREISGCAPVSQTAAEISHVAELCITEVSDFWNARYRARWGDPASEFAVIGLGKFGGSELNFSSDIDVLFVYSEDGQLNPNFGYKDFFTRLAEKIVATFSGASVHGPLFRIDLRLRPDGASGALVRSLESTENYYAAYGEVWERMMLIKARPVAGDAELGYEFGQHLQPFIFPRHLTGEVLQEIAHIKHRIDTEYLDPDELEREIKRGRGGIREIEFVIQSLQLLHGAQFPFLQQPNTLKTIESLRGLSDDAPLLDDGDAEALEKAYRFLRLLEHRIQIEGEQQTQLLPKSPEALRKLSRSLGFATAEEFHDRLVSVKAGVRSIFEDRFSDIEIEEPELDLSIFTAPAEGEKHLAQLGGDHVAGMVSPRTRRVFARLQPTLMAMLGETVEPDLVLNRLLRFVENYGIRATLYELLVQHPRLLEWLLKLFDSSAFVSEIAIKHPELAEEAARGGELDRCFALCDYVEAFAATANAGAAAGGTALGDRLRLFRSGQLLRIALRDVLEVAPVEEIMSEYTALAEACLVTFAQAVENAPGALTMIGMGKFGAGELSYGSDLDLIFVGDDFEAAVKLTREFGRYSAEGEGALYEVDTRLRPEGDAGPLTARLSAFERYFDGRAALWEGQALTRARPIHGGDAEAFMRLARETWHRFGTSDRLFPDVRAMLEKIHLHRGNSDNPLSLKSGSGGMIDVEFTIQALQMRHDLWETNTLRAIEQLAGRGELDRDAAATLSRSYTLQRRVLFLLRRLENRSVSDLPEKPGDQEHLARRLAFPDRAAFFEEYEALRAESRVICQALLAGD